MEYNKLISVTGFSGLFELVSSKTDGAIVKSLDDNTTKFVSSRMHQLSHLETIEVYTTDENVNLIEVFNAMNAADQSLPQEKDNKAVRSYFEKVFPAMDFERVYSSDMKKMVRWFGVIKKHGIELKLTEAPESNEESEA
ncbi:MAG: hypothetical protein RL675_592 [Bacteroidota bacterium]